MMAEELTLAETLFEQFLRSRGVPYRRIPEVQDRRTPDYELGPSERIVFTEVKQIDLNPGEQRELRRWEEGEAIVSTGTPGQRIRRAISDGRGQLADASLAGNPTMLVIYDATCRLHGDGYNVLVGMYGLQTLVLSIPHPFGAPQIVSQKFGPKQKMTIDMNTSISALGVIRTPTRDDLVLDVYHNWYARCPLDPSVWTPYGVSQHRLGGDPAEGFQEWESVV